MDEKEYMANLVDDKMLFDEILPGVGAMSDYEEELEQEYKSGIKYERGLKNHKKKSQL